MWSYHIAMPYCTISVIDDFFANCTDIPKTSHWWTLTHQSQVACMASKTLKSTKNDIFFLHYIFNQNQCKWSVKQNISKPNVKSYISQLCHAIKKTKLPTLFFQEWVGGYCWSFFSQKPRNLKNCCFLYKQNSWCYRYINGWVGI